MHFNAAPSKAPARAPVLALLWNVPSPWGCPGAPELLGTEELLEVAEGTMSSCCSVPGVGGSGSVELRLCLCVLPGLGPG